MELALVLGGYATLIGVSLYSHFRGRERRELILLDIARARSGVVDPRGWNREPSLFIVSKGIELRVTADSMRATRWVVHLPPPGSVVFSIAPGTPTGTDARLPGTDELDHHFQVSSDDPPLLRGMWKESYSKLLAEHFARGTLSSDGEVITLVRPGLYESHFDVERGLDLLMALARVDVFGIGALRELPDGHVRDGDQPMVEIDGPEGIELGPRREHKRTYTIARARSVELVDAVSARVVDGRIIDDAGIPEPARGHLRRVGTAQVYARDGMLEIRWPTIERNPERLGAAIELLRTLSRPRQENVFR